MRSSITFIRSAAIVSLAQAATLRVDVGLNGLAYTPNTTTAAVGDFVEFHFHPKSHNVVQTSFDAPCNFGSFPNPFYSGFVPVSAGEASTVFRLTINDTKPIWYYCGQVSHCQSGMVGVINQPASGNTLDVFKANAAKASGPTNPTAVSGGVLVTAGNSTAGASGSASTGAATTASGTAAGTAAGTSSPTNSAAAASSSSAGEALRALRWNELLGMGIAIGGAAVLMQ